MSFILDFLGVNVPSNTESEYYPDRGQNAGASKKGKKRGRPRKVGRPKKKTIKKKRGRPRNVKTVRKTKRKRVKRGGYKGGDISTRHFYGMPHSKIEKLPESLKARKVGGYGMSSSRLRGAPLRGGGVKHPRHAYGMAHEETLKRWPVQKGGLGIKTIKKLQKKLDKIKKKMDKARAHKKEEYRKKIRGVKKILKRLRGGAKHKKKKGSYSY